MNELPEMLKGLTDIPLALLSAVFCIILMKKQKKSWSVLFLLIFVSAFLGTAVHVFSMSFALYCIVWIILYALLFESIRIFTTLMVGYISGIKAKKNTVVFVIEAVLYAAAVVMLFIPDIYDIYALVAFMIIMLARVFICVINSKRIPRYAIPLSIFLILPVCLQALAEFIPYAVVMEHCSLIAALIIAFRISLSDKKA